jgi:hypothetical protein
MRFLLNGAEHKVDTYGPHVFVDDTLFTMNGVNWNEVYHHGYHVYTLHFETYTMETGKDYQTWYDQDQIPVHFEYWLSIPRIVDNLTKRNIKNIIINHTVYKIEGAAHDWPRPRLYLQDKHVGYIREGKVEWTEPPLNLPDGSAL